MTPGFWRNKNFVDVFFSVTDVSVKKKHTVIYGTWCTQGVESWWFTVPAKLSIKREDLSMWVEYVPKGRVKL